MATEEVLVPGLNAPLLPCHFVESRTAYNRLPNEADLPNDAEQAQAEQYHSDISSIISKHGVKGLFGIHLLHSHFAIAKDHILLGSSDHEQPIRRWAKPTITKDVSAKDIHGYIFAVTPEGGMIPCEFQKGVASKLSKNTSAFLSDFIDYVQQKGLHGVVGLEVREPGINEGSCIEVILGGDDGNILVEEAAAPKMTPTRYTGWSWVDAVAGLSVWKGTQRHATYPGGKHIPYTDGKPLTLINFLEGIGYSDSESVI